MLGHLQRGGSPTHRDRLLALRFGAAAVRMVEQGKFGHIVAYNPPHMVPVPMEEAIATMKTVPLDSDTVQTARDLGICLGDCSRLPTFGNPRARSEPPGTAFRAFRKPDIILPRRTS